MNKEISMIEKYYRAANYLTASLMYIKNDMIPHKYVKVTDLKKFTTGH